MTTTSVTSGLYATHSSISSGNELDVLAGGTAILTVLAGGSLVVSAGGAASSTQVWTGTETVYGVETGATVTSQGDLIVSQGGTLLGGVDADAPGTGPSNGPQLQVYGTMSGTRILGGASATLSGASAVATSAALSGTTVSGGLAHLEVLGGAIAVATSVGSGAELEIASVNSTDSGFSIGAVISSRGQEAIDSGGFDDAAQVLAGGLQLVFSGGMALAATIGNGATQELQSGGTTTATSVAYGGTVSVLLGGTAVDTVLNGSLQVSSGGYTVSTAILSGGYEVVGSGATTIATSVFSGGVETVSSGGTAQSPTVFSGGILYVIGSAVSTTVDAGGTVALEGANAPVGGITFNGAHATVQIYSNIPGTTLSGFTAEDLIDDYGSFFTPATSTAYTSTGPGTGTLVILSSSTTVATINLAGVIGTPDFHLINPGYYPVIESLHPQTDFNNDGKSDLLLQNTNGALAIDAQSNLAVTSSISLGNPGATWHAVATADFNGDGNLDILLQNTNGQLVTDLLSGTALASQAYLGNPGSGWHVRGAADFNADGRADILLQNDNGAIVIYDTNGTAVTSATNVGNPGQGWTVEAVADFNGDNQPDILVQNTNGALVIFTMSGSAVTSGTYLGNPGSGWAVAGTGDYNNDGQADILLHNDGGANVVYEINNAAVTSAVYLGNPGASYTVAVPGLDLSGNGTNEFVVQRNDSQVVGFTLNTYATVTSATVLTTPGQGWQVLGNNPTQFIDGTGPTLNLTATPGADQFVLTSFAPGLHTISGFDPAQDKVALSAATFPTYATVQANEAPYQGGTFIALTPGTTAAAVIIQGVTPSQLTATNFILQ